MLKTAFQEDAAEHFHFFPHQMFWKPSPDLPPERIYSDLYTADSFINEHLKIRSQPHELGCQLETVVAAIMLWSDLTHLTSFGNASLWLIYMFFSNLSKYIRAKPTSFAAHHLAYIPKVRSTNWQQTIIHQCMVISWLIPFKMFIVPNSENLQWLRY